MAMGWIRLHRKLIENPIFLKPELLQLFIYCLLKANHKPNKIIWNKEETTIEQGQFITGRDELGKAVNQNPRTTYDRLKVLEKLQIINIKSNNKFSLVTVVNYALYQLDDEESNSKSNNKPTTNQQQANTNKNDKNVKNENKNTYSEVVKMTEEQYQKLVDQYGKKQTDEKILNLSLYIKSKGVKYKCHYSTILSWERKNNPVPEVKKNTIVEW